jgi:D-lactate dehydrogenase
MKILFYSTKSFEIPLLQAANKQHHDLLFEVGLLSKRSAHLANGCDAVCIFTSDDASADVIETLYRGNVKHIAIRATGYDNVEIEMANDLGIRVANVPAYSPFAIAEHAMALILALNRKLALANAKVHAHNFTIEDLIGFDLKGKTVGIIGTGAIGSVLAKILHGFGCRLLGYDLLENKLLTELYGMEYVNLPTLYQQADIISLHVPLNDQTKYMIDKQAIRLMKKNVMLINTSRGGCVHTIDVMHALQNGEMGYFGADVYEKEKGVFFTDLSKEKLKDEQLTKLINMPNVLITPHQAFATNEALSNIAATTMYNIDCWSQFQHSKNEITTKQNMPA